MPACALFVKIYPSVTEIHAMKRPSTHCLLATPALLFTTALLSLPVAAQDASATGAMPETEKTDVPRHERRDFWDYVDVDADYGEEQDYIDKSLGYVLTTSHKFANWVDSFFDDTRTQDVKNQTRLKLGYWVFRDQEDEYNDENFYYSIKVKLPKLEERFQLFIGNEDDDDTLRNASGGVFPEQVGNEETFLGIRAFDLLNLKDKIPGSFSTSFGIGYNDGKINPRVEPRYIYRHNWDTWSLYFRQKVRWSRNKKWQTETLVDFDRALSERFFFRLSNELWWDQENDDFEGYEYYVRPIIAQRLKGKQALQYEWNNRFRSEPEHDLAATSLLLRYRRQVWKPWFFVEVAPQVTWRNDYDWETSYGIFAKAEILMRIRDK